MKKLLFSFAVLAFCACNSSKKKTESPVGNSSLEQRLAEYMKLNDDMNLDKIMDYIYPKLFTIAPRHEILKAMKDGFNNEEVKVELDSMKIDRLYPVFEMNKDSFAKITYSMVMLMNFATQKDSTDESNGGSQNEFIMESMAANYGKENVSYNEKTGAIKIRQISSMVAVKDGYAKEWSFVSLKEDDPMINKLFSKEVLEKLATYK